MAHQSPAADTCFAPVFSWAPKIFGTGPLPRHNASTRPEHQRPGTRRAVRAREPQITAGHRLRIDRKRARPYDGHGPHRPGSFSHGAFPRPEDEPPAVAATGTTPACCARATARCVRRRAAREMRSETTGEGEKGPSRSKGTTTLARPQKAGKRHRQRARPGTRPGRSDS